jgi:hypothetical protein
MLSSPEITRIVGAFVVATAGAMQSPCEWSEVIWPAGVEEHEQTDNWGSPGTWEILSCPRKQSRKGTRATNPRLAGADTPRRPERKRRVPVVPPSEGNEVRREARQEVAVP